MRGVFFVFLLLFSFVYFSASPVFSQGEFAACDLCGYCPPNNPPSTWEACRSCIYPNASSDASSNDTLRLGSLEFVEHVPPSPYPGRSYTMIGCIRSDLGSFGAEGAAGSVVQILLNVIFSIAGGLAFLFLIYGAFVILTSQANPERINYGKKVLFGAIIGVIFTVGAVFLVNLLASGVLQIPGFGGTSP